MVYAEVKNTQLIQYPYGFDQLQADNPYTNYGSNTDVAYWFPQTDTAINNDYTLAVVVTSEQPPYDVAHQNCVLNDLPNLIDGVWVLGWTVTDFTPEQQAQYYENIKTQNKNAATALLQQTDWTAIASVADPAESNPYLTNRQEFLAYRSTVRAIAVNPPTTPAVFPEQPQEVWSS
jgi:hypothetical protein